MGLLLETAVAALAVIGLLCLAGRAGGRTAAWVAPWVLTVGAVAPTLVRGRELGELGLRFGPVHRQLRLLALSGLGTLVLGLVGLGVLKFLSLRPPLAGAAPPEQWFWWGLFQFGVIALPEELFFRGYVLTNSLRFLRVLGKEGSRVGAGVGLCMSAGVFALAHVLVWGNAAALVTFFPGLILAWLFWRSGSLWPPVILHGAANIGYIWVVGRAI